MSYCLSIHTNEGLVLCAASFLSSEPTQANATLISSRMERFVWPGNRLITILCSGNKQTIDGVIHQLQQDLKQASSISLLTSNTLDEAADYIAETSVKVQQTLGELENVAANFIVAGQIGSQQMATLLVYAQGNYIQEPNSAPFLQIGEIKFGKPILDRMIKRTVDLNTAAHCALVSVDSSIRSNPCEKMTAELLVYKRDSHAISHYLTLNESSHFFNQMSASWNNGITHALESLPRFTWEC